MLRAHSALGAEQEFAGAEISGYYVRKKCGESRCTSTNSGGGGRAAIVRHFSGEVWEIQCSWLDHEGLPTSDASIRSSHWDQAALAASMPSSPIASPFQPLMNVNSVCVSEISRRRTSMNSLG